MGRGQFYGSLRVISHTYSFPWRWKGQRIKQRVALTEGSFSFYMLNNITDQAKKAVSDFFQTN